MIQAEAGHQSTTPHPDLLSGLRPRVSQLAGLSDISGWPKPFPSEWTPPSYFVPLRLLSLVGPTFCSLYPLTPLPMEPQSGDPYSSFSASAPTSRRHSVNAQLSVWRPGFKAVATSLNGWLSCQPSLEFPLSKELFGGPL